MKNIIGFIKNHKYLILTVLFTPMAMHLFMIYIFRYSSGGSNDGWLGFWGSYLGSIISIFGVFWTFSNQRIEDIEREKRNKRPLINFAYQNGIKQNDRVYHSTTSISYKDKNNRVIKVYNPSDNIATSILIAIYDAKNNKINEVVNIQHLRNESAIVLFRESDSLFINKVLVSFITEYGEIGLSGEIYPKNDDFTDIQRIYGKEAKNERENIINVLNNHNQRYNTGSPYKWGRNETIVDNNLINRWEKNQKEEEKYKK